MPNSQSIIVPIIERVRSCDRGFSVSALPSDLVCTWMLTQYLEI